MAKKQENEAMRLERVKQEGLARSSPPQCCWPGCYDFVEKYDKGWHFSDNHNNCTDQLCVAHEKLEDFLFERFNAKLAERMGQEVRHSCGD